MGVDCRLRFPEQPLVEGALPPPGLTQEAAVALIEQMRAEQQTPPRVPSWPWAWHKKSYNKIICDPWNTVLHCHSNKQRRGSRLEPSPGQSAKIACLVVNDASLGCGGESVANLLQVRLEPEPPPGPFTASTCGGLFGSCPAGASVTVHGLQG